MYDDEDPLDMFDRIEREQREKREAEEAARRRQQEEEEKASGSSSGDSLGIDFNTRAEEEDQAWLESSTKFRVSSTWKETIKVTVPLEDLVWAHNACYKGGSNPYFPARICDKYETATTKVGRDRKAGTLIVEFLSRPDSRVFGEFLHVVKVDEVYPFNRPRPKKARGHQPDESSRSSSGGGGSGGSSGGTDVSVVYENKWNAESVDHMFELLKTKMSLAVAQEYFNRIMAFSNKLLEASIEEDRKGREHLAELEEQRQQQQQDEVEEEHHSLTEVSSQRTHTRKGSPLKRQKKSSMYDYARKKKAPMDLKAGLWISYQHQIFHDQNITGVQIIRIDPRDHYPVKLSNGDSLQASDEIRLHKPEDEQSKWKNPYEIRYIEDFTLIKSEDKSIASFEALLKQHAISEAHESSPQEYTEAVPFINTSSSGRKRRSCA